MNKKRNITRIVTGSISIALFVFILVAGLKVVFKWDWGAWFFSIGILIVGLYLLIESGIKSYKKFISTAGKPNIKGLIHLGSFGLGLLMVYISVQMMLGLPALAFTGWVLVLSGIWAIVEGWTA